VSVNTNEMPAGEQVVNKSANQAMVVGIGCVVGLFLPLFWLVVPFFGTAAIFEGIKGIRHANVTDQKVGRAVTGIVLASCAVPIALISGIVMFTRL